MKLKTIVYFLLLTIPMANDLFGQKVWSLEDCIQHAMRHNLQIKQAENNLSISDQILLQNQASRLPSLNGNGTHNYNFGRNIDPFTNQFTTSKVQSNNFALNSSLVLFNGLQVNNTIKQSRYDYLAASYQVETLKNDLSLNIAAAYLDILFNAEQLNKNQEQLTLTYEQLERSQKLIAAGSMAPTVLYDLNAQKALEESQVIKTKNALSLSYLNLAQYLDLAPDEITAVVKPESILLQNDSNQVASVEAVLQMAMRNQPQIKNAEYRRLSTIEALHVARGRQSPRLTLNASISTLYSSTSKSIIGQEYTGNRFIGYTQNTLDSVFTPAYQPIFESKSFNNQFKDNYNRFLGFSLSIPILNGLQTRTSIHRAKLNVDNADLDLKISKQNLEKNIQKAFADANGAEENYTASYVATTSAKDAFVNAEKRFDAGLINTFEYNQSKTNLKLAQSDLIRAKYDYLFKLKIIDFYNGVPLKL